MHLCCRSVLTFSAAAEEDLGLYTAEVIDKPDISSSFNFTAEGNISFHLSVIKKEGLAVSRKYIFDSLAKIIRYFVPLPSNVVDQPRQDWCLKLEVSENRGINK